MIKSILSAVALLGLSLLAVAQTDTKPTVAGKWHFVFETQGGSREFDSVLEQSGDTVTGKWAVSETNPGADVKGTFTERQLLLSFPIVSPEAGPGTMTLKGHLENDGSLTGDWNFGDYAGTFKATHPKTTAP